MRWLLISLAAVCAAAQPGWPQYPGAVPGATPTALPRGLAPSFGMEDVTPEIHKTYVPIHLPEYHRHPWFAAEGSFATEFYKRYLDRRLEGDEWYDSFGNHLGRGWLVYSWEQRQSLRNGSFLRKRPSDPRATDMYGSVFQSLVIASDGHWPHQFSLMIGDQVSTHLTPLTFNKPRYNGLRLEAASDRHRSSLLLSRPSSPDQARRSNSTHLFGGHTSFQLLDAVAMGVTYVNAHNAQTQVDFNVGNPLHGALTTKQNQPLQKVWVRLRDDSPEDGIGGASLFRHEILLVDQSGRVRRGRDIGLVPRIRGGVLREGAIVADGSEAAVLEYDLASLGAEHGMESLDLQRVSFELAVADDYRVEMASNLQTDGEVRNAEPVFTTVARARGNVRDNSNSRVLKLDYLLPTGNELIGVDFNVFDAAGLSLQGEAVLNRRHGKYPNLEEGLQHHATRNARAGYAQVAYQRFPWKLYAELFSIDDAYATAYWLTQSDGTIRFKARIADLYEFVDDDDDFNAVPEWERPFQPSTREVAWPGYDENGDFIYDHNQNVNLFPDYDEPFLRYRSDRPEFLFGTDMNHNGTIDRFENDSLPDYPYRRDHRGYNIYLKVKAGGGGSLLAGRQNSRLISGDGHTRAFYGMATWKRELSGFGQVRVFDLGALVRDDIPDDLRQWVQPVGAIGRMRDVEDPLAARNTWKNSFYADLSHRLVEGLRMLHRFKWDVAIQRDGDEAVAGRLARRRSGFVGLIDKAEWSVPVGLGFFQPRWKSELRFDRPYRVRREKAASVEETVFLLWSQPLLAEQTRASYFARYGRQIFDTTLQAGLELSKLWMLKGRRAEIDQDLRTWTAVVQLTNQVAYQGYRVVTRTGMQWTRRAFEFGRRERANLMFFTVNAGLE